MGRDTFYQLRLLMNSNLAMIAFGDGGTHSFPVQPVPVPHHAEHEKILPNV